MNRLHAASIAAAMMVAGCASQAPLMPPAATPLPVPQPPPPPPPPPANALGLGVITDPPRPIDDISATRALAAFKLSCPALLGRVDQSGLTQPGDWQGVCGDAAAVVPGAATAFFNDRFGWLRVGPGTAFATGYYEPQIRASRVRAAGYGVPVYALPAELVRCTRADGTQGRGMVDASGQCLPFHDRAAIEDGALANRGLEIAWAADPVELFFLEVQGSGRLVLPDGSTMRIGYAGQNGREYVAIGRLLRDRGLLPPGGATMQGIVDWIAANPEAGRALMRENPSYVFFRELTGPGPIGALGVAVTPHASVAADPRFIPLGAPVMLEMDRPEASGLWVAQDTGGAIKGVNRVDTFWGAGDAARITAGGMSASGRGWVLVPREAAARLATGAQASR